MSDRVVEHFPETVDRLKAAAMLHDRISGRPLGPRPEAPSEPHEGDSAARSLLRQWISASSDEPAEAGRPHDTDVVAPAS